MPVTFPPGWRVAHLAAAPPSPPPRTLPAPRSVPVPGGPLLVVVNDAQRATPTPWLMGLLDCDWSSPDVRIAVATGCHAPPTEPELREIFGGFLDQVRSRIHVHRAASDPLVHLGTTSRGTPVEINRLLDWPAAVVCLGSVEPHYFAGWTGGRKSLVPGLCSLETMRANHRLAIEPGAALGALSDNPLHLDLEEAAGMVRARLVGRGAAEPLGVNALVARGEIHGWHAGPLHGVIDALAPRGRVLFGRHGRRPGAARALLRRSSAGPRFLPGAQGLRALEVRGCGRRHSGARCRLPRRYRATDLHPVPRVARRRSRRSNSAPAMITGSATTSF